MSTVSGDDPTSQPTRAFGAVEDVDATRQAQHALANDAPVDVNMNAVICREQAGTLTLMGKNFEAGAARLNGILDAATGQAAVAASAK